MTRFQLSWWMKRRNNTQGCRHTKHRDVERLLRVGKVCRKRQTKQALQDFFTTGNIKQLRCNLHLAEQQGAQISMVYGTAPAVQIAEYARVSGVAKIVMGRINHKSGAHHGENSPADQLTDLEVYILPNCQHLLRGRLENCVCRKHIFPGEMRASCGLRCCYPQET